MRFTQHIVFYADDEQAVRDLVSEGGAGPESGLLGARLMRFRNKPGRYVIQADFSSLAAAEANNDRPETQEFARRLESLATSEIKWENLDVLDVLDEE